ncbi:MAG: GatB/YqeY domain-containing protein [Candidatus Cyclobacteriaceae bacterium M2_1C_046]
MSLKERIDADIKAAMKSKNKEELTALRSIKSKILLAETEKSGEEKLSEETEMRLLTKEAKQRKDSIDIFEKEGREDLAEKERFELEIINRYLPQPLTEEELDKQIEEIVRDLGASGPQDMGKVMGAATKKLTGRAEGKVIADRVKNILNR